MENLEFNSAVYTTKEQSEKLLTLGLKKETADIMIVTKSNHIPHRPRIVIGYNYKLANDKAFKVTFAWSLYRLMEIAYKGDILGCVALNFHERNIGAYYEQVIKVIEYLIGVKEFNKDYLEEKK